MAAPRSTARRFLSLSLQQTRCYSAPTDGAIPPNKAQYVPSSGTYPKGFIVGSTHAQVKASNTKFDDLALIASEKPCAAAVVSTQNVFRAAPVKATLWTMKGSGGRGIRGVVINSGCANAVTGSGGMDDAVHMARLTDNALRERNPSDNDPSPSAGDETNAVTGLRTLVMSTGVIGQRLPIDRITSKIPALVESVGNSHDHWLRCARAICTTDTFPKLMSRQFSLPGYPGVTFSMAGMTKGAGMIHPNMATLLGAICTDVPIDADALRSILKKAVNKSFNRITVDGDTSTNDTVAVFANGMAAPDAPQIHIKKNATKSARQTEDFEAFSNELSSFMQDLAKLIVRDGEGATKFVAIRVQKASTPEIAHAVANSIATSALVKTALYGKDANWGRILCAIGYAPGDNFIRPNGVSVSFVPADGSEELKLLVNGEPQQIDETRASAILEHEDLEILVNLSNKPEYKGETTVYTCDFSHEYVTINGDYRT